MNPIDELAGLLPPGPPGRELPRRDQHHADLLALIEADQAAEPQQSSGPAGDRRRWLHPSAAAVAVAGAVVIVAVAAVALPRLTGSGTSPGGPPAATSSSSSVAPSGPPGESLLTVTRHWTVPAGSFTRVDVSTSNGPVTVTGSATGSAVVTAAPSYRGTAPALSYFLNGGVLFVHAQCPQVPHCQVALRLVVPARLPVSASTYLGSVRLTGLSAGVVASSQLGSIYLTRIAGVVTAETELGQVSATGLAAYRATLTTQQGSVDAAFLVAPDLITASSELGSVTIQLPSDTSYAVTATADLGSTSVTVPQSHVSRHVVKASSQLGSVTVSR